MTAMIALVTAVVGLVFQLAPAVRPDPRDRVGADVQVFALEPNVSIGAWIDRAFAAEQQREMHKRYPDTAAKGELLIVRTTVDGHKHRNVSIRYAIYPTDNDERVSARLYDAPPQTDLLRMALRASDQYTRLQEIPFVWGKSSFELFYGSQLTGRRYGWPAGLHSSN